MVCKIDKCNKPVRARKLCSEHWNYEQYGKCINTCNQPASSSKGLCHNCRKRKGLPPKKRRDGKCSKCKNNLDQNARCSICRKKEQKRGHLKRKYNIDLETWELILFKQNNLCKICGLNSKRFVVDHDHSCCNKEKTCGKCIRGIICENCNRAIGLVKESSQTLINMINYLQEYKRQKS